MVQISESRLCIDEIYFNGGREERLQAGKELGFSESIKIVY